MFAKGLPSIPEIRLEAFPHITYEEYKTLLSNIKEQDKILLLKIMWHLGLRVSEVLSIKANDLFKKPDGFYLRVKRLKRRVEVQDNIPIPVELGQEIEEFIKNTGKKGDERLFKISRIAVFTYLDRVGKKYLNRHIHPHMFRHGRVYYLIKSGVHPLLIIKLLGWSSLEMILRYYHPTPDDIRGILK